jgi:hypothetical protein
MSDKLNIVLVHGAFGDGLHWRHIIPGLYQAGTERWRRRTR